MNSSERDLYTVRQLTGLTNAQIHSLAQILVDCVEGGASVSFMHPLSLSKALAFWRRVASRMERCREGALAVFEESKLEL
jgi:hypothetical protein